jgi:hypothetical protein
MKGLSAGLSGHKYHGIDRGHVDAKGRAHGVPSLIGTRIGEVEMIQTN